MVKAPVIGIWAPAPRSGKSTLAAVLAARGCLVRPFAGPLKAMLDALFIQAGYGPELRRALMNEKKDDPLPAPFKPHTARHLLQTLGTEWGRERIHSDVWVDTWRAGLVGHDVTAFVADDMRFPNEAKAIRAVGGLTVKLMRPGLVYDGRHASEGGLADWDFDMTITNDGSIADLGVHADAVLRAAIQRHGEAAGNYGRL